MIRVGTEDRGVNPLATGSVGTGFMPGSGWFARRGRPDRGVNPLATVDRRDRLYAGMALGLASRDGPDRYGIL